MVIQSLLALSLCLLSADGKSVEPLVSTHSGILKGMKMLATEGTEFLAFRGIPYAKPPLGPLRFQDPQPADPWEGTFDATKEGDVCLQFDERIKDFKGSEDCLKINIYTHNVGSPKRFPVMVFIHGGSWVMGSGNGENDIYGPHNFLDRDIVFVTINYRLSALGFLSTEDAVAPGNYGLLDQNLALQWIKKNIDAFGGDSNSITLFGHSSGAGAVHTHMLSPRSEGLFHRAILQSGSALCPWSTFNYVGEYTKRLAKFLKCPTNSSLEIIECLREKNGRDIIKFRKSIEVIDSSPIAFGPRIDKERSSPFLPSPPRDIIRSGIFNHVPFITGVTANEAGFIIARLFSKGTDKMKEVASNPSLYMKYAMGSEFEEHITDKAMQVYHNYFPNQTNADKPDLNRMEEMMSDGMFFKCAVETMELHAAHSSEPVYSYLYAHRGLFTFPMLFLEDLPVEFGISHGDEIFIEFAIPLLPPLILPEDMDTEQTLLDLWTSFSLTSVPSKKNSSVEWLPIKENERRHIVIKDGDISFVEGNYPFESRLSLWDPVFGSNNLLD